MADIMQYVWPLTVLVIFLGMLAIGWRSLDIAHDLAKIFLQAGLSPQGLQLPKPAPVPVPTPVTKPIPTLPTLEVPDTVVDQGLVNFIKKQEGYSAKAYWDYKQWTSGYGTKANSATEVIDEAET